MDHAFVNRSGDIGSPILVVHGDDAQNVMALFVPSKGAWMNTAHRIARWTNGLGHGRAILKTDQGVAIVEFMEVPREVRMRALEEMSTRIRTVRGMKGDEQDGMVPEHSLVGG